MTFYAWFTFRDINTKKLHTVKAEDANEAVRLLNKKVGRKVNYEFLGRTW